MPDVNESMDHLEEARKALIEADRKRPPLDRNASRLYDIYIGEALTSVRELMELAWPDADDTTGYESSATSAGDQAGEDSDQEPGEELADQAGDELAGLTGDQAQAQTGGPPPAIGPQAGSGPRPAGTPRPKPSGPPPKRVRQ